MDEKVEKLRNTQQLVNDIQRINRGHNIVGKEERENVVEHSFSVAMLCWRVHDDLELNLNLEKIFKYCLSHDFLERGLENDVSTYASADAREKKKERERKEFVRLSHEFSDFKSLLNTIDDYENMADEEARFVWCIDKMQAIILGDIDNWRPYKRDEISYQDFYEKWEGFLPKYPDYLLETVKAVVEYSRGTYYDRPIEDTKDSNPD